MKAIYHNKYGSADVLHFQELPVPIPIKQQVLIKVYASTINRTDCGFLSGKPYLVRLFSGLFTPKSKVLGNEFSGEIVSIGKQVDKFNIGDKVFGYNDAQFGAHSEYILMNQNEAIATIPNNIAYDEAAAICEGAHYALCDIKAAKISQGQIVLVIGATGAIGSAAVQLLKHYGATVYAVCGTQHLNTVKLLGADYVIDYMQEDFTQLKVEFDFIFDAVGKSSFSISKKLLKPDGIYISTELGDKNQNPFLAIWTYFFKGKKLLFPIPTIKQDDVLFFKMLIEKGEFKPLIDSKYPFHQFIKAFKYVQSGQKIGNVILQVSEI